LSRSLATAETKYLYVEKLALATIHVVQCFRHYILLRRTTVISDCNPMQHILTRQLMGGKYSKWIVILQEFEHAKSKKSLVFAELICDLPSIETENVVEDSLPNESLFLISFDDIWYGDIIIYLQTQTFQPDLSSTYRHRIRYQTRQYNILGDTLYRRGIDSIFRQCLTYDEAKKYLNNCHSGACGGHICHWGYKNCHRPH
jgi:hypothetical protein